MRATTRGVLRIAWSVVNDGGRHMMDAQYSSDEYSFAPVTWRYDLLHGWVDDEGLRATPHEERLLDEIERMREEIDLLRLTLDRLSAR